MKISENRPKSGQKKVVISDFLVSKLSEPAAAQNKRSLAETA